MKGAPGAQRQGQRMGCVHCSRFVARVVSGDPAGHPTVQTLVSPNTPMWVKVEACWRTARDTPSLVCTRPTHPARLQWSAEKGQVGPHLGSQIAWICPLVHHTPTRTAQQEQSRDTRPRRARHGQSPRVLERLPQPATGCLHHRLGREQVQVLPAGSAVLK